MNTLCPGCGLSLPSIDAPIDPKVNASAECRKLCYELSFYTLKNAYPFFIHQVLVDAYGAQHYKEGAPKVGLAFALFGLCLLLEHNYSGKEVQDAHIRLAKLNKNWPSFIVPEHRGTITVADVLAVPEGDDRDKEMIRWAASVWDAYKDEQEHVRAVLREFEEI